MPEAARQLAGRLADAFEQDRGLAEQQNACQDRLRAANGRLWVWASSRRARAGL
ncbi:MAG: hypothetical protein ACR2QA_08235 [Solirubrobacteraceae bacterium]